MPAQAASRIKAADHPLTRQALAILGPLGEDLAFELDRWDIEEDAITIFPDESHVILDGPCLLNGMGGRLDLLCDFVFPLIHPNSAGAQIRCYGLQREGNAAFIQFEDDDELEFSRLSVDLYPEGDGMTQEAWLRDRARSCIAEEFGQVGRNLKCYADVIGRDALAEVVRENLAIPEAENDA